MPNEFNIKNGFISNNNSIVQGGFTATTISSTTITTSFSSGSTLFAGASGQISQNNSQFFWDNVNNRLGVGTNSPQAKLDVASSTGNTAIHITSSALTNSDINFINSGYPVPRWTIRGSGVANGSSGNLVFQRLAGTSVMSITENTNVLIGTTTDAGYKLDVVGSTRLTNAASQLILNNSTYSEMNYGATNYFRANGSSALINGPIVQFLIGGSEKGRFATTTGNLLLGTTTDSGYMLDVNGTVKFGNGFIFNTDASARLFCGSYIQYQSNATSLQHRFTNQIGTGLTGTLMQIDGGAFQLPASVTMLKVLNQSTELLNLKASGNLLLGTTVDSGYKLDVSGGTRVVGTKGSIITSGSSTTAFITVSGSSTVGGTGYTDFIQVTNTAAGATNINKTIRLNNTGAIDFINSAYNATIFSVTDVGAVGVGLATTTSSDATSNYLSFGNNNTQIYDDGNTHIHSRGANQAMWINTNNGQINIGVQSPVAGGAIASAIAFGSGIANGYVTINTGRTVTTSAAYGYLTTGGAGTYPGGSQSVVISLYANNRIWGQEIDAFSDERMKDIEGNITLEDGLKLVNNLKPIKYRWKKGDDKGIKAGYSAQQVIKSGFDHLVSIIPNEGLEETIDEDGFMSPKDTQFSMNYDQVTPYHGVVIKHLLEQIELLKEEIQELKNK